MEKHWGAKVYYVFFNKEKIIKGVIHKSYEERYKSKSDDKREQNEKDNGYRDTWWRHSGSTTSNEEVIYQIKQKKTYNNGNINYMGLGAQDTSVSQAPSMYFCFYFSKCFTKDCILEWGLW